MHLTVLIIGTLIVGSVLLIFQYKKLARFNNKIEQSWSDLNVQFKRRYDLLPELIKTVKHHAKKERDVFDKIARAQNQAISAGNVPDQATAENNLSQNLKSLFAISEDYPELKTSENFRNFQQQLSDVEDEIKIARRNYNAIVRENNTKVKNFPTILFARPMGFGKFEYFEMDDADNELPKIKFKKST